MNKDFLKITAKSQRSLDSNRYSYSYRDFYDMFRTSLRSLNRYKGSLGPKGLP